MAIDAGTVYYTVDAKTQKAIDDIVDVNTSLEEMEKTMAKTDVRTRQFKRTITEAGGSISKTGVVVDKFGDVNAEATQKMQKLMATTDALSEKQIRMTKVASGVSQGVSSIGRNAGQAGIQIQQFVGQIQGGQSAMLALSQQGADLGFVLGAPLLGAVVGIGASIAGMLLPNLFKTTDALDEVEKATERVRAQITLSSEGVTGYSDKMKVLAQVSESLARIELANMIADQTNAMKVSLKGLGEAFDDAFDKPWSTYESNVKDIFGEASYSAFEAASELRSALGSLSSGIDEQKINNLAEALQNAKNAGMQTTEAGIELTSTINALVAQYKLGEMTIEDFKKQLDGAKLSFDDVAESATKYDNLLKRLTIRSNETKVAQLEQEKALVMLEKGFQELEPEKQQAITDAYDLVIANTREAESEKALAKAKRETAAAERESRKASKAFIKDFGIEGDDFSDPDNPDAVATEYSRSITSTYNEESTIEKLEQERAMIEGFRQDDIGNAQAHADALIAIDTQLAEERKKVQQDVVNTQLEATNAQLGIYNQLFSGMQSMTSNMLASMNEQSNGYKVMFAVQKAFAVAQAIVAAELAANQILAHDAGILGMGAVATSNVVRAMGYASAGVIAGTAMSGGRQYGGPVAANGMYRINENGAPEVFNAANGQQYMLPNTRGEVVSNKDASGGGGTVINVNISQDGSVSTDGGSAMQQFGAEIGQFVEAKFKQLEAQSIRQGGTIWQYSQKGRR